MVNQLQNRPNGKGPQALQQRLDLRQPFPLDGREKGTLRKVAFLLDNDTLQVSALGFDRLGLLKYLTGKFLPLNANIESCYGEKHLLGQGSHFQITAGKEELRELWNEFMSGDLDVGQPPLVPERFFDLQVKVPRDGKGLLYAVACLLEEHKLNVSYFWADKLPDLLFPDKLLELGVDLSDLPFGQDLSEGQATPPTFQVTILSHLEAPADLDNELLKQQLEEKLPAGSRVELPERRFEVRRCTADGEDGLPDSPSEL